MNRRNRRYFAAMSAALVILVAGPSYSFIGAAASAANEVRDEIYKAFMKLKAVETVKALRDNYVASVRYYDLYKRMNEGKGIFQNSLGYVSDIGKDNLRETRDMALQDWVRDPGYNSDIEKYVRALDKRESERVRMGAKELEKYIKSWDAGADLEKKAGSLSPSEAQKQSLRAQAIEIQLLSSLNTEMLQLLQHIQRQDAEQRRAAAVEWQRYQDSVKSMKGNK